MKKKVFIHLHQGILKGGVEKVFHTILNNLPISEYKITVLSVMGYLKDDFDANIYPNEVIRHCLMWDEFSKTSTLKRIRQKIHNRIFPLVYKIYLRFKRFDVAIAGQEGDYARFVIDKVNAKRKILWIHNDINQCHWTAKLFITHDEEAQYYKKFDNVVCVSQKVAQSMSSLFGDMDNLCVCYNPIDTREIDYKLRSPLPEHPEGVWFVCVGRLVHQKGFDRLINACRRLNDEAYAFHISILGEGEDRQKLEEKLREFGFSNVDLLGNQANPYVYMKAADWFLQTSRHEGFGLALYEAAYCQTPIITTDVAGAKELLGESKYGIITDNSEIGIYTAIKRVLDNPNLHGHFKEAIVRRSHIVSLKERINQIQSIING